jgi:hypothetical protein
MPTFGSGAAMAAEEAGCGGLVGWWLLQRAEGARQGWARGELEGDQSVRCRTLSRCVCKCVCLLCLLAVWLARVRRVARRLDGFSSSTRSLGQRHRHKERAEGAHASS